MYIVVCWCRSLLLASVVAPPSPRSGIEGKENFIPFPEAILSHSTFGPATTRQQTAHPTPVFCPTTDGHSLRGIKPVWAVAKLGDIRCVSHHGAHIVTP